MCSDEIPPDFSDCDKTKSTHFHYDGRIKLTDGKIEKPRFLSEAEILKQIEMVVMFNGKLPSAN